MEEVGDKAVLIPLDGMPDNIIAIIQAGNARDPALKAPQMIDFTPGNPYYDGVSGNVAYGSGFPYYGLFYMLSAGAGTYDGIINVNCASLAALYDHPYLQLFCSVAPKSMSSWGNGDAAHSWVGIGIGAINAAFYGHKGGTIMEQIQANPQVFLGPAEKSGNTEIRLHIETSGNAIVVVTVSPQAIIFNRQIWPP